MAAANLSAKICGVYAIVGPNRVYIGHSIDIVRRWKEHVRHLDAGKHGWHGNKPLQAAWDKYGEDAFEFLLLAEVPRDRDLLALVEQECMGAVQAEGLRLYNTAPAAGSMLGFKHSDEAREKISAAGKGRRQTDEWKRQSSERLRLRKRRPETYQKVSEALKGRPLKQEHCEKLSQAHIKDLTGQVFGNLTAVEYADTMNTQARWRCKCTCGNESIVYRTSLMRGQTQSCGCRASEKIGAAARGNTFRRKDITGQKFGDLTVLSVTYDRRSLYASCKCSCGNDRYVRADCLRYGSATSCIACSKRNRK